MIIKKHLINIEIADNDLFLFITGLLRRIEKKHSDHLEVVEVDNNYQTILFISSSYDGANLSRVLMMSSSYSGSLKSRGRVAIR